MICCIQSVYLDTRANTDGEYSGYMEAANEMTPASSHSLLSSLHTRGPPLSPYKPEVKGQGHPGMRGQRSRSEILQPSLRLRISTLKWEFRQIQVNFQVGSVGTPVQHRPQSVNRITGRQLFRTGRNAIMAIQCLELLYVALFAWILGKNVFY